MISNNTRTILLLSGLLVLLFVIVFFNAWQGLISAWSSSDDSSHGFLVVPLSLYVLWNRRASLKQTKVEPSWFAFPLVIIALTLYVLSHYAEIATLAYLSIILFIGSSLLFLFGLQMFKVCSFSIFLLLFMVPVPSQVYASLTAPLQLFVTKITVTIAFSLGIPILREGNVIHLPEQTLQVVQACSGLRSIVSLLMISTVIGYFGLKSSFTRLFLSMAAIPVAILVNVVRVFVMILAFYYFGMDLSAGTVHSAFGIMIFGLAIVFFVFLRKGLVYCER